MNKKEHSLGPNNLHTIEWVPDKKTYPHPLVLVHGSFGGNFMWNKVATYLVEHGFHIFAPSLRGHKPNDTSVLGELDMDSYKKDIVDVVADLGIKGEVVVGHSMGGLVALMYAAEKSPTALVAIDPSPSAEVGKISISEEEIAKIPDVYTPQEAGMPKDPQKIMEALSDIPESILEKMKEMLGPESGSARRHRKRGVSVPKENLSLPRCFIAGEKGGSVPFGIGIEKTKAMHAFYGGTFVEIAGATHPGIIMGKHAAKTAAAIDEWLRKEAA